MEVDIAAKEQIIKEKNEEIKILYDRLKMMDTKTGEMSNVTENSNPPLDQQYNKKTEKKNQRRRKKVDQTNRVKITKIPMHSTTSDDLEDNR